MGRYKDISIKKLVEEMNIKYFLPDIQRPFIWKNNKREFEDKVCKLFDSVLRGYPIGTFLFWKVNENLIKEYNLKLLKFLDNSNKDKNDVLSRISSEKDYVLVLDGQQRITIFNLVFNGVFEDIYRKNIRRRNLYFNLLTDLNKGEEIEDVFYEFKLFKETEGNFFIETINNKTKLWYNLKGVLNLNSVFEEINNIKKKINLGALDVDELILGKNLEALKNSVVNENLSFYEIDKSKKDDEALEIFVRVNAQGMVLSYSDLLFSKIIQYWKKDKNNYNARDIFYQFLKGDNKGEIKGINRYGDGFKFNNDFILKTSLVLINKEIKYKLKNFNEENITLIKNNWSKITSSIRRVVEFLPKIGITSSKYLRSLNSIIPIVYFIYKNNLYNKSIEFVDKNRKNYKKFIYVVLLNGVFGGQTDYLLKLSRDIINKNESQLFPVNELLKNLGNIKPIKKENELLEFLDEIQYNTDKSKIILKILYGNLMDDESQEDHLFPQKKLKKKYPKKLVDNIANLQVLKSENQNKGNKDFKEWLKDVLVKVPDFKEKSFIPKLDSEEEPDNELKACGKLTSYDEENFEVFLARRKILIHRKIKNYFN